MIREWRFLHVHFKEDFSHRPFAHELFEIVSFIQSSSVGTSRGSLDTECSFPHGIFYYSFKKGRPNPLVPEFWFNVEACDKGVQTAVNYVFMHHTVNKTYDLAFSVSHK